LNLLLAYCSRESRVHLPSEVVPQATPLKMANTREERRSLGGGHRWLSRPKRRTDASGAQFSQTFLRAKAVNPVSDSSHVLLPLSSKAALLGRTYFCDCESMKTQSCENSERRVSPVSSNEG
jgi:hypothetical protein